MSYSNERASLVKRIAELNSGGKAQTEEIAKLNKQIASLDTFKRRVEKEVNDRRASAEQMVQMMMLLMMQTSTNEKPPAPPPAPIDAPVSVGVRIRR